MNKILIFICACILVLSFSAAHSQGFRHRFRWEDTIGISARDVLHKYLDGEYQRSCSHHAKNPPDICSETKPLYVGSGFSDKTAHPLPPEIMQKIGFVEPGTEYVQSGLVVYLISIPRRLILDEVDIHNSGQRLDQGTP